jgi:hypothetical protein
LIILPVIPLSAYRFASARKAVSLSIVCAYAALRSMCR